LKKATKGIVLAVKTFAYNILKNHIRYTVENPKKTEGFTLLENRDSLPRYHNLYLSKADRVKVRRRLSFGRSKIIRRSLEHFGMVVIPASYPSSISNEALVVPNFIDLTVKLPADINTYQKTLPHTARCDVRRMKNGGFTASISNDINWVSTFYKKYYEPSMQMRHGEEAYIMPENQLYSLMQNGKSEFIKIYSNGICIAALLGEFKNNNYYFLRLGWLNGDHDYVKKGAVAAMYWHSIQRAFDLNCNEMILGGTPAYLESGVFKYKAKWQATFSAHNYNLNFLLLNPVNHSCYRFLKQTSLIALNKQNLPMVLSGKKQDEVAITGPILTEFAGWYILRNQKSDNYNNDVEELPPTLRYWYERVA